jgi:hypothetical protein
VNESLEHEGYKLAHQEGLRALAQQQSVLDGLRSRAGTLLAATALATSFLGGLALQGHRLSGYAWPAIGLFLLASGAVLWVLTPRGGWRFRTRPSVIIQEYVEGTPPAGIEETYKELAKHLEKNFDDNQEKMDLLFWGLYIANIALAGEVGFWLLMLWRR